MGANPRIYSLTHANRSMIFTVRTLNDNLLEIFQAISQRRLLCMVEGMVTFKGRSQIKQYNLQRDRMNGDSKCLRGVVSRPKSQFIGV